VTPSANVWRGIEQSLGLSQPVPAPRPRRWPVALAAAAAVLALVSLGLENTALTRQAQKRAALLDLATARVAHAENAVRQARAQVSLMTSRCDTRSEQEALTLLDQPGTQVVALAPAKGSGVHATAIVNTRLHQAFVLGASMPTVAGKDYELWVIRGKAAPIAAGLMRARNGVMVGEIDPALLAEAPDALAVSLERQGGVASPTDVKAVGALRS